MSAWHVATRFNPSPMGNTSDTRIEADHYEADSEFVVFFRGSKVALLIPTASLLYAKRLVDD